MNTENIPAEVFVQQVMATKPALAITDEWPIKADIVLQVVVKHLNDMGIYNVSPNGQNKVVKDEILFFLRNSVTIIELIEKAKRAAAAAAQRGRANRNT